MFSVRALQNALNGIILSLYKKDFCSFVQLKDINTFKVVQGVPPAIFSEIFPLKKHNHDESQQKSLFTTPTVSAVHHGLE